MLSQTRTEEKSYKKQKFCHIYKEKFNNILKGNAQFVQNTTFELL